MKLLSTNILYALASSPPQCQQALTSTTTGSFISQKEFMPVLRGKVNLKADYDSSLDGESFKHMEKLWDLQFIHARDMAGERLEPPLYWKDSHKSFAEWNEDWGELRS